MLHQQNRCTNGMFLPLYETAPIDILARQQDPRTAVAKPVQLMILRQINHKARLRIIHMNGMLGHLDLLFIKLPIGKALPQLPKAILAIPPKNPSLINDIGI